MPELPEVEIATRNLRRWAEGGRVVSARAPRTRVVKGAMPTLVGQRIEHIERRGKRIRITMEDGRRVFAHLGMTGKWVLRKPTDPEERWERARIDVKKSARVHSLRYVDMRMFGRVELVPTDTKAWSSLGPDPLHDGIDVARLAERLRKRGRPIKEALMDQALLAGVGNIQATDALWLARVDPRSRSNRLEETHVRAIARAVKRSIEDTIRRELGPEITYVEEPGAPNPFRIYGRAGEPCPRCRTPLRRIVLGGRGTVFCSDCQVRR